MSAILADDAFALLQKILAEKKDCMVFIKLVQLSDSDKFDCNRDDFAASISSIRCLEHRPWANLHHQRPALLDDHKFMSLVAETASAMTHTVTESVVHHIKSIVGILNSIFGNSQPTSALLIQCAAGTLESERLTVRQDASTTARSHINSAATMLPACDHNKVCVDAGIDITFLPSATLLVTSLPVVTQMRAVAAAHRAVRQLCGPDTTDINKLILPNVKPDVRKATWATLIDAIDSQLQACRAVREAMAAVSRHQDSDVDIKKKLFTIDAAQGSDICWISASQSSEFIGRLRETVQRQQSTTVDCILKFATFIQQKNVTTLDAINHSLTDDSLTAWDEPTLKKSMVTPCAVGLSNLRDLIIAIDQVLSRHQDTPSVAARATTYKDRLSETTKLFSAVTAFVGIFRQADRAAFCGKLAAQLCTPGSTLLPPLLQKRLNDIAAAA